MDAAARLAALDEALAALGVGLDDDDDAEFDGGGCGRETVVGVPEGGLGGAGRLSERGGESVDAGVDGSGVGDGVGASRLQAAGPVVEGAVGGGAVRGRGAPGAVSVPGSGRVAGEGLPLVVQSPGRRRGSSSSSSRARRSRALSRDEHVEWVYRLPEQWRLDRSERLRSVRSGELVHDGYVVELGRLWQFPVVGESVVVPRGLEQLPELGWVAACASPGVWVCPPRRVLVWFVDVVEWQQRARSRVDVSSSQFDVRRVVDLERFAELAGLSASTLRAYRSRGLLPAPVAHVGVSPVWTREQVASWLLYGREPG